MKKQTIILAIIPIMISFITLFWSIESAAYEILEPSIWKDGVYTEMAQGRFGEFQVTVTIENSQIKDILVGEHYETPDIGGVAIKELPPKMIEKQSHEVDVISGATVTSNALKDAVARCLEKASINNEEQENLSIE